MIDGTVAGRRELRPLQTRETRALFILHKTIPAKFAVSTNFKTPY